MVTSGYTSWAPGEPDYVGGNENCVVLVYVIGHSWHGKWNDVPCSGNRRYLCERRLAHTYLFGGNSQHKLTSLHPEYDKTTNNDPLEPMKTCEFSTIHVVIYSLGSIVGTSVVFIIGILIYCKKRRNHDITAPPPPQQELYLEPRRHYYDITNQRNQAQHDVIAPPPPQQGEYLEPIRHDINDGYVTFEPNQ
uniref:uncharacterized protein LOC108950855 n=1 Tax=Ciona intestinalis TaxID=7719 RepID=UPI000EF4748E|nr:uncharacterized protein LOC108950855 [Ciona intestinalis]|eukprot:XP_026695780.1 uncharacterized protein LOC108950855 [Ciona intestinalis]